MKVGTADSNIEPSEPSDPGASSIESGYSHLVSASPTFIPPMELLAVTRLPEGPEWGYEVKLDGYRAQAIHGSRLRLLSRRGKDFSSQFRETYRALASAVAADSIVDGELVALDAQGRPDFQSIQNSRTG